MEQRIIKLSNFSSEIKLQNCCTVNISQNLKCACILSTDGSLSVYSLSRNNDGDSYQRLIWKSTFCVHSFSFSEDGNELLVISEARAFKIFKVCSNKMEQLSEKNIDDISNSLEKYGIEFSETSKVTPQVFQKGYLVLFIDSIWLVHLQWYNSEPALVTNKIELPSCVTIVISQSIVYSLTLGGNVSAYTLIDGKHLGVVNLYSLVPRTHTPEIQVFSHMTVSVDGTVLAVADRAGQIFAANIKSHFQSSDQQEESSRWDCGASIVSTSSTTSRTSVRTTSSLLVPLVADNTSLSGFELPEKQRHPGFISNWNSYIKSLKQKSSISVSDGGSEGNRNRPKHKPDDNGSRLRYIARPPEGLIVRSLHINSSGLSVWYTELGVAAGGMYQLYDVVSGACLAEMLVPEDTIVIAGGFLGLMDAFLSSSSLWLFLGNLSRDVLVNKLLHCVETESIGQLLQGEEWSDLVVPLAALANGLRQQQMDVARLALGLHAQAFKSAFVKNPTEGNAHWQTKIDGIITNMDKLFNTIHHAIAENPQKVIFREHLVLLSLNHANDLLHFLHESASCVPQVERTVKELVRRVMYHVVELRRHLYKRERNKDTVVKEHRPLICLSCDLQEIWDKWEGLEDVHVIQDAVLNNNIPLVQVFLLSTRGWSQGDFWANFKNQVHLWTQQLLIQKHIEKAKHIFVNIGCEPYAELKEICMESLNKDMRDNLAQHLFDQGCFEPDELDAWIFLKQMEDMLEHIILPKPCNFSRKVMNMPHHRASVCDVPFNVENCGRLSIKTIAYQSNEWKDMVLIDMFFNIPGIMLTASLKPELVWNYLLHHNREDLIISWIDCYFLRESSSENNITDLTGLIDWVENLSKLSSEAGVEVKELITVDHMLKVFSLWGINQTMVDSVCYSNSVQNTKDVVLDHLSRFGVFCSSERQKPNAILSRLIRTRSLYKLEHTLELPTSNVTFEEFQDMLTTLVIKNELYNVPFACLRDYEFSEEKINALCMPSSGDPKHDIHWFQLWLSFREFSRYPADEGLIYSTIVKSAQYLSKGDVQRYLKEHPLVVVAIMMFSSESVSEILQNQGCIDFALNKDPLDAALKQFPSLEMALSSMHNPIKKKADVTVYQLLQGCTQFDISKLFGWQKLHLIEGEEFPYFASNKLIDKYGSKHTLTYYHYLKQARPSFAMNRFIVDQFKSYGKLSKKMVKEACNFAHGLALQNFEDRSITCGCIAFVEMLGQNAEIIKVHIAAANKILTYLDSKMRSDYHSVNKEKIDSLLYGLVSISGQKIHEMLMLLQDALQHDFPPQCGFCDDASRNIVNSILNWNLAVKFARLHGLKLPEMFLMQCAANDEWLQFILFSQIYCYPVDQVLQLVTMFRSPVLQEHLLHALGHNTSKRSEKSSMKLSARDSRKTLYTRIGLKKGEVVSDNLSDTQSIADDSVYLSTSSSDESPQSFLSSVVVANVMGSSSENDIFLTLLKCHGSSDPPRALLAASQSLGNPVLAVFATCYEPSSVLSCFCIWLLTSLPNSVVKQLTVELNSALEQHMWTAGHVEKLIEETVSISHISTLARGFRLFLRDNPLCAFSDFLCKCVVQKHFKESVISIKLFKAAYLNLQNNALVHGDDALEGTFMTNGYWVASVAMRLTCIVLAKCFSSAYHQLQFLYTLQEATFTEHLPVNPPDLAHLTNLLECITGTGVSLNLDICLHNEVQERELLDCLNQLVLGKFFSQGLEFATLTGLPKDIILIAQWCDNFEQHYGEDTSLGVNYTNFWNKCNQAFEEMGVKPYTAAKFFQEHAEKVKEYKERYHILQLALQWFHRVSVNINPEQNYEQNMAAVEVEMWMSWLLAEPEIQLACESTSPVLLYSLKSDIVKASDLPSLRAAATLHDEQEKTKLNTLIGKLLVHGEMATAYRLEAMFNHKNEDLQILLTCMSLAEGELTPYQLTAEHRLLLSETTSIPSSSYRRRTLLSSVSSKSNMVPDTLLKPVSKTSRSEVSHSPLNCSIGSDYIEIPARDRQDTLLILEKLAERMTCGKNVGRRVVMCYRVAMNLDKNYQDIIALQDPLSLLKTAIADDCLNKFIVASDLMTAAQISRDEVAEFLCEEIISAITRGSIQGEVGGSYMWGCDLDTSFHLVLDICEDPSILGSKLLSVASQIGTSQLEYIRQAVELTVRAHDCYTAACNMEGIASVLHKSRTLTSSLQNRQEWALMVRLLTGVRRYTEMNYIFKILQENEQFEFLLGKGLDKVPGLKLAVLDFLKLNCPEDRKLFQITALHFAMFGEVAILWMNDGKARLDSLLAVARLNQVVDSPVLLSNTDDIKQSLQSAMECFRHAAEFYLQANKLTRAMASAHQAELVALQIALVSSVPAGQNADSLLKLNSQEVSNIISNKLSFPEACIIARAYSHPVDWGAALFQHCIVHKDAVYLSDFTHNMTLTTALVEDVARRFQMDNNVTQEMSLEMKKFVQCVSSVEVKYRVASQLGYRDIIESLLNGPEVAYLKDTVWLRGFRR